MTSAAFAAAVQRPNNDFDLDILQLKLVVNRL
jgi:hypothetical protein